MKNKNLPSRTFDAMITLQVSNACRVWGGVKGEIQVFRKKFYTHIHLN